MKLQQKDIIAKITKFVKDVTIYAETSRTLRVDIAQNNALLRKKKTGEILALFSGATVKPGRPNDVSVDGNTILIKPAKGAKKTGSGAEYGLLAKIDLSFFDTTAFGNVCKTFTTGKLATNIKESSDVKCVSDLNTEIARLLNGNLEGINIKIHGFTFRNVIGCIPVTIGEPKADVVLVCRKGKKLYPDAYISYKMGKTAKDFQQYSGLSEKSSKSIFDNDETYSFFAKLHSLSAAGIKDDVMQAIHDKSIIGDAIWGKDYGGQFGVDNCHFIGQGDVSITSTGVMSYSHSQKNGDMNFGHGYEPVFGARYATGRGNKGPRGMNAANYRIGIFPRAYRSKWMH